MAVGVLPTGYDGDGACIDEFESCFVLSDEPERGDVGKFPIGTFITKSAASYWDLIELGNFVVIIYFKSSMRSLEVTWNDVGVLPGRRTQTLRGRPLGVPRDMLEYRLC